MGQRSVFGYFQTMEQAKKAAKALKENGYKKVSVDRFSPSLGGNPFDGDEDIQSLLRDPTHSLASVTLGSSPDLDDDERILAATHVDASGQSGGTGFAHVEDICVTVITNEVEYKRADKILKQYGAKD